MKNSPKERDDDDEGRGGDGRRRRRRRDEWMNEWMERVKERRGSASPGSNLSAKTVAESNCTAEGAEQEEAGRVNRKREG